MGAYEPTVHKQRWAQKQMLLEAWKYVLETDSFLVGTWALIQNYLIVQQNYNLSLIILTTYQIII